MRTFGISDTPAPQMVKMDAIAQGVLNVSNGILVIDPASPDKRARFPEVLAGDVAKVENSGLAKRSAKQPARLTGEDETEAEADTGSTVAAAAGDKLAKLGEALGVADGGASSLDTRATTHFQISRETSDTTDEDGSSANDDDAAAEVVEAAPPASGRRGPGRPPKAAPKE